VTADDPASRSAALNGERNIETMSQGLSDIANDLVVDARSNERAVLHLNALNKPDVTLPRHLGFSYGRALQAAQMKTWGGKAESLAAAQAASFGRAGANGAAILGAYA
jgi:fructose-bisphosphate aldolase class 1